MIPAAKVTLAAPSGIKAIASSGRVGAAAAINATAPNPNAEPTSRPGPTRPRAPVTRAPTTDPAPIATARAVYVAAPPSKLNRASNGRMTWKL